jgi:hypothetical protein
MLSVYKRKDEFISSKAIFMADRDMWFFTGIPDDYAQDIVYTQGYSIENDMYLPETFESLLSSEEAENFRLVLNQVVLWFSVQVAKALSGGAADCKAHVNHLCPECELADEFKVVIATSPPNQQLVDQIAANYHLALRGKSLFELLVRFLSHQKRQSKFSKYNLLELGSKLQNPKADSLIAAISQRIP